MSTNTFSFSTSELATPKDLAYLGECEIQHTYTVEYEMCIEDDIEGSYPHILTATCETRIYYGQDMSESVAFSATEIFQNTTGKYIWSELEVKAIDHYFTPTYEPHPAPTQPLTRPNASGLPTQNIQPAARQMAEAA